MQRLQDPVRAPVEKHATKNRPRNQNEKKRLTILLQPTMASQTSERRLDMAMAWVDAYVVLQEFPILRILLEVYERLEGGDPV